MQNDELIKIFRERFRELEILGSNSFFILKPRGTSVCLPLTNIPNFDFRIKNLVNKSFNYFLLKSDNETFLIIKLERK